MTMIFDPVMLDPMPGDRSGGCQRQHWQYAVYCGYGW